MWRKPVRLDRVQRAVDQLELPEAVFRTCPWTPRSLVETGLRQWLRCAGAALRDGEVIGMPSRAVDEAWHGLVLCTVRYAEFCDEAYGRFLHHHPEGGSTDAVAAVAGTMADQLARTVYAWSLVAKPGEQSVLWDLDTRLGLDDPWGVPTGRVAELERLIAAE